MKYQDKRQTRREKCYGKLYFLEGDTPAYIRNISEDGMRIECPVPLAPRGGLESVLDIEILPEGDIEFKPFKARVQIRWVKSEELFVSVGLKILEIEAGAEEAYQEFLQAYKAHSSEEG